MSKRRPAAFDIYAIRFALGAVIATLLYYTTQKYVTMDCQTIHLNVHNGGIATLGRIVLGIATMILLGFPIAGVALLAGIVTTPLVGAALTSFASAMAFAFFFLLGRLIGRDHPIVRSFEGWASQKIWFSDMHSSHSTSGIGWTAEQSAQSPLPTAWFSAYCGAVIRHLTLPSLIAGTFVSTSVVVLSYSFAGSYIGCAVIDRSLDLPIRPYLAPAVLSGILLLISSRLRPRFSP